MTSKTPSRTNLKEIVKFEVYIFRIEWRSMRRWVTKKVLLIVPKSLYIEFILIRISIRSSLTSNCNLSLKKTFKLLNMYNSLFFRNSMLVPCILHKPIIVPALYLSYNLKGYFNVNIQMTYLVIQHNIFVSKRTSDVWYVFWTYYHISYLEVIWTFNLFKIIIQYSLLSVRKWSFN